MRTLRCQVLENKRRNDTKDLSRSRSQLCTYSLHILCSRITQLHAALAYSRNADIFRALVLRENTAAVMLN